MSEIEDVPPADIPPADFVAWMTAEAPELAGAGRKLSRRRQPKILGERAPRRRLRERTGLKVVVFVVVLAVIVSLPFVPGWLRGSPVPSVAGPVVTAAAGTAREESVFPLTLSGATGTYDLEAFSDPGGCASTAGVSPAMVQAVAAAGDCVAIRSALYVDSRTRFRIEVCVIVMAAADQVPGLLPLAMSPMFGFIHASRQLPPGDGKVYTGGLAGGASTVVLTIGEYFTGINGDTQTLVSALQSANTGMSKALGITPPSK